MNIGRDLPGRSHVETTLWKYCESKQEPDSSTKKRKVLNLWNSEAYNNRHQPSKIFYDDKPKRVQFLNKNMEKQVDGSNKENTNDATVIMNSFGKSTKAFEQSKFPLFNQNNLMLDDQSNHFSIKSKCSKNEYIKSREKYHFVQNSLDEHNSGFSSLPDLNYKFNDVNRSKVQHGSIGDKQCDVDSTLLLDFLPVENDLEGKSDEQMLNLVDKFNSSLASIWQKNIPTKNIPFKSAISPTKSSFCLPPDVSQTDIVGMPENPEEMNWFFKQNNNLSESFNSACYSDSEKLSLNTLQKLHVKPQNSLWENEISYCDSKSVPTDYLKNTESDAVPTEVADYLDNLLSFCSHVSSLDDLSGMDSYGSGNSSEVLSEAVNGIYSLWGPPFEDKHQNDIEEIWSNLDRSELYSDTFSKHCKGSSIPKINMKSDVKNTDNSPNCLVHDDMFSSYAIEPNKCNDLFIHYNEDSVFSDISKDSEMPAHKPTEFANITTNEQDISDQITSSPTEDLLNSDRTHFQPILEPLEINNNILHSTILYSNTKKEHKEYSPLETNYKPSELDSLAVSKTSCYEKNRRLSSSTEELISILGDNFVDNEEQCIQEDMIEYNFFPHWKWKTGLYADKATNTDCSSFTCHCVGLTCNVHNGSIDKGTSENSERTISVKNIKKKNNDIFYVAKLEDKSEIDKKNYLTNHIKKERTCVSCDLKPQSSLNIDKKSNCSVSNFFATGENDISLISANTIDNLADKCVNCKIVCMHSDKCEKPNKQTFSQHLANKDVIGTALDIKKDKEYDWKSLLSLMTNVSPENSAEDVNLHSFDLCMYQDDKFGTHPSENSYCLLLQENYPYTNKSDITTVTCLWETEPQFDTAVYPFLHDVLNVLDSPDNEVYNSALSLKQRMFFSPLSRSLPVDIENQKSLTKNQYNQERSQFSLPNLAVYQD